MNKKIIQCLMLLVIGIIVTGCQKDEIVPNVETSPIKIEQATFSKDVEVLDGALVFENEQHLSATLESLSLMSPTERIEYEDELGFRSQGSLWFLINEAETNHQESFFKGVDPNLEVEDYEEMGYFYENTALYAEYLNKEIIKEFVNEDRSTSFELVIDNPRLENIVNEDGVFFVGEKKHVLKGKELKEYSASTGELLNTSTAEKVSLNGEYDFQKNARRSGHESQSGNKWWITDPAQGNNYRYYAQAYFHSSFTTSLLAQTYFWTARAEQKKWGNWATRNNYNPIWGIAASWNYDYWVTFKGQYYGTKYTDSSNPLSNSSNLPTSSYYLSNLHTNYTVRNMHPNGVYTISVGAFWENLRVFNNSYVFKFSGGSSGYNYTGI